MKLKFFGQKVSCAFLLLSSQAAFYVCSTWADDLKTDSVKSLNETSEPSELMESSTTKLDGHVSEAQTKEESEKFRKMQYGVIGMRLMQSREHQPDVLEVFPTCPAANAGIRPGDIVLKAGDHELSGMEAQKVFWKVVTGKPDTSVDLTILRDGQTLVFHLVRMNIEDIQDDGIRQHFEQLLRSLGRH